MSELLPETRDKQGPAEAKLACLRVGGELYALDIMCIREIIRPLPIIPVPKAPLYIEGVIKLRNAVIPIVDLRRRFGLQSAEPEAKCRMVICAVDGRIIGLVVDEVTEVRSCTREDVRPAPYYLSGEKNDFFPAVCRSGDQLLMLLDLRRILSSDEQIAVQQLSPQPAANAQDD